MQAQDFVRKWGLGGTASALNERAGAQPQFIDLCRVLGVPEPADLENYCFERGLTKTGSAGGRTDGPGGRRSVRLGRLHAPGDEILRRLLALNLGRVRKA